MKRVQHVKRLLLLPIALIAAGALAVSTEAQEQKASATFINANNEQIGTAMLTQTPGGVLIDINVKGVPSGEHGFHIHETGKCEPPDFKSAGGHYNPTNAKHGFVAGNDKHAGDMPNQFVQDDGVLRAHVLNSQVTLKDGEATLFDADGSALVIHMGADDYNSQPSGEAGERFACAVIMQRER
jgi:Cu-Zn family superoxide dismutase